MNYGGTEVTERGRLVKESEGTVGPGTSIPPSPLLCALRASMVPLLTSNHWKEGARIFQGRGF